MRMAGAGADRSTIHVVTAAAAAAQTAETAAILQTARRGHLWDSSCSPEDVSVVRGVQRVDELSRDWQDLTEGQP